MTEFCGTQGHNRHKARLQHLGRPLQCIMFSTVSRTFQIELVGYLYVYVDSVGLFLNSPGPLIEVVQCGSPAVVKLSIFTHCDPVAPGGSTCFFTEEEWLRSGGNKLNCERIPFGDHPLKLERYRKD